MLLLLLIAVVIFGILILNALSKSTRADVAAAREEKEAALAEIAKQAMAERGPKDTLYSSWERGVMALVRLGQHPETAQRITESVIWSEMRASGAMMDHDPCAGFRDRFAQPADQKKR